LAGGGNRGGQMKDERVKSEPERAGKIVEKGPLKKKKKKGK